MRGNRGTFVLGLICAALLTGCGEVLPSPETVTAQALDDRTVQVTWEPVAGAEGYRVFKRDSQAEDYRYICQVDQTSYLDSGVTGGETYFYKIKTVMKGTLSQGTQSAPVSFMQTPSILHIRTESGKSWSVDWEDTGAESYQLYGAHAGKSWTLIAQTQECHTLLSAPLDYDRLCVSALYQTAGGEVETPRSQREFLLASSQVTAVTQLDLTTAAVQYEPVEHADQYRIYRCDTKEGDYTLAGTSYDTAYYDQIEQGQTCFYKVQPVTERTEGPLSEGVSLGSNAKEVRGVAVFMYHEFVTQEDLDRGVAFDEYAIWEAEFEQDLQYLKDHGYTTITSAQLADFLSGTGQLPDKPVMLTIDDGKLGVYKRAYPLLQKYGMKAVLAVIGERIDAAQADPQRRLTDPAPYCNWTEIAEMSRSGAVEIVSHSYTRHRYRNNGYRGADMKGEESEDDFYQAAFKDYERMQHKLTEVTGKGTVTLSYPYSVRSAASDRVWMRCGYQILFAGDGGDVRRSYINYYVQDAGINYYSALTRRLVRMTGDPLEACLARAFAHDGRSLS